MGYACVMLRGELSTVNPMFAATMVTEWGHKFLSTMKRW